MTEDMLTPLLVEGVEIATVRLAEPERFPDAAERRRTNLGLGVVQLPSLLERFRPQRPMLPQERFLVLVQAFATAMNDGRRNQLDEGELARLYMKDHGVGAALAHQVYRAAGDSVCQACEKRYGNHPYERSLLSNDGLPFIHRLCNGDLVKL